MEETGIALRLEKVGGEEDQLAVRNEVHGNY
jgi:hypothetical protein